MNVKIDYLIPGVILAEDVYKHTPYPIVKKKTVLTNEHITILKMFLIPSVTVESKLVDGRSFQPKQIAKANLEDNSSNISSFIDQYLDAVQKYKKHFSNWQGGSKVDINQIRKILLPLFESNPQKEVILQLHHYGTKDDYLYFHSVAVSILCYQLGKKVGLSNGESIQLGLSGLLADCGMSKLPFNVFEKKGPLTIDEYSEVKRHPLLGFKMLEDIPGLSKGALLGVIQHHEREDGNGYPLQLKGEKIHLYAKILTVCDMYHAMVSERHYRVKQSPYKVMESLKKDQFGKLDHLVLQSFIQMMLDISIGKKVRLNNGMEGEILFIDDNDPVRPVLNINNETLLRLTAHSELYIEEVMEEKVE